MKFNISIDMESAAFDLDDRHDEIQRLLASISANDYLAEMLLHGGSFVLRDVNGNACGKVSARD